MIYEPLKNSFRIYDNIAKQSRFLKSGEVNNLFGLICPSDGMLPWQMRVDGPGIVQEMIIRKPDDSIAYDLSGQIGLLETKKVRNSTLTYLLHFAGSIAVSMAPGKYYLSLLVDDKYYYSEEFTVLDCMTWADLDNAPYIVLIFDNECGDLGPLLYQTGWRDYVFLDTVIEKEEPSIFEEGSEDEHKDFIPFMQKYIDNLNMDVYCPFFLAETLTLMSIHKNVDLRTVGSLYTGKIKNIKTSVATISENIYAVNVKMQQETLYVNTGCCEKIDMCDKPVIQQMSHLPQGHVNVPYSTVVNITGGDPPFGLIGTIAPTWMTVEVVGNQVKLSGTPDVEFIDDTVFFEVSNDCGERSFESLITVGPEVCVPIAINNADIPLPDGTVGVAYQSDRSLTGTAPYNINPSGIVMPAWMSVAIVGGNTLRFSGTPNVDATNISVSVNVTNACGNQTFASEMNVFQPGALFVTVVNDSNPLTPMQINTLNADGNDVEEISLPVVEGDTGFGQVNGYDNVSNLVFTMEVQANISNGRARLLVGSTLKECVGLVPGTYNVTFTGVVVPVGQNVQIVVDNGNC